MIAAAAVLIIVAAGGGYYEGTLHVPATAARGGPNGQFQGPGSQKGRFANGAGFVGGTIVAIDSQSITVQLGGPNASSTNSGATGSKIVLFNPTTQVGKFVTGTMTDLKVGSSVMIQGQQNSDGSVTANSIQIRPEGMSGFGQGRARDAQQQ